MRKQAFLLEKVSRGKRTPFEEKLLLIGTYQGSNTNYYCAEEQIENSYQLSLVIIDGIVVINRYEIFVHSRLHIWGNLPNFNIINPELEALGYLKKGRLRNDHTIFIEAAGFLELCLKKINNE